MFTFVLCALWCDSPSSWHVPGRGLHRPQPAPCHVRTNMHDDNVDKTILHIPIVTWHCTSSCPCPLNAPVTPSQQNFGYGFDGWQRTKIEQTKDIPVIFLKATAVIIHHQAFNFKLSAPPSGFPPSRIEATAAKVVKLVLRPLPDSPSPVPKLWSCFQFEAVLHRHRRLVGSHGDPIFMRGGVVQMNLTYIFMTMLQ